MDFLGISPEDLEQAFDEEWEEDVAEQPKRPKGMLSVLSIQFVPRDGGVIVEISCRRERGVEHLIRIVEEPFISRFIRDLNETVNRHVILNRIDLFSTEDED